MTKKKPARSRPTKARTTKPTLSDIGRRIRLAQDMTMTVSGQVREMCDRLADLEGRLVQTPLMDKLEQVRGLLAENIARLTPTATIDPEFCVNEDNITFEPPAPQSELEEIYKKLNETQGSVWGFEGRVMGLAERIASLERTVNEVLEGLATSAKQLEARK